MPIEKTCANCGINFTVIPKRITTAKFCSNQCHFKYRVRSGLYKKENNPMFGKKRPEVGRRNKGKNQRAAVIRYNRTRIITEDIRANMGKANRIARLREKKWSKEKNPVWRGGVSENRRSLPKNTRKLVLERDGGKCQKCASIQKLEVHHIIPYFICRHNKIENLITLCKKCHLEETYAEQFSINSNRKNSGESLEPESVKWT